MLGAAFKFLALQKFCMDKDSLLPAFAIVALVLAISAFSAWQQHRTSATPAQLDEFARCMTRNGAKFYGASWCTHCREQKDMFGESAQYVNYVECSPPGSQGQEKVCTDADVQAYPTWEFAGGKKEEGVQSLESLGEKTGCRLG
jgi:hypothetical protein